MKKLIHILYISAFIAGPVSGLAQSGNILTQTLTWHCEKGINLITSDTLTMEMNFKSFTSEKIEYIGPRGPNQVFDITSIEGAWTNIAQNGSITYHVSFSGQPGKIIISRTAAGVYFTVDMTTAATGGMKTKFIVETIE